MQFSKFMIKCFIKFALMSIKYRWMIIVRDYSDVLRLFCQTSWGRGTSELIPYQKVDICPSKIDVLLRRFWCQLQPWNYINGVSICSFFIHLFIYVSFTYLPPFIFPYFNSFHSDPSISAFCLSCSKIVTWPRENSDDLCKWP